MTVNKLLELDNYVQKNLMIKPVKINRRKYYWFTTSILNYLNNCLLYNLLKEKVL